jgi:hypothetical protein
MLSKYISKPRYPPQSRWMSVHTAGAIKFQGSATAKALNDMVTVERPARELIVVGAWSIQQITGKTIALPQSQVSNPAQMTVRDATGEK